MTTTMQKWESVPSAPGISAEALAYVAEVNAKREAAHEAGLGAQETALGFLNRTRECAVLLETAKAKLSDAQWKLAQGEFNFTAQQIQGLLTFARRYPEAITDAEEIGRVWESAQMTLGFAEFPDGHGPQTLHAYNFATEFTKLLTSVRATLKKKLDVTPIAEWSPTYASQVVTQARLLVTDINTIYAQAQAKAAEPI